MKLNPVLLAKFPAPARLIIFVLIWVLLWLPFVAPLQFLIKDSNLVNNLTILIEYIAFIILVRLWGKFVYNQPKPFSRYGLQGSRQNAKELLIGLGIGLIITFSLFAFFGLFGWVKWQLIPTVVIPQVIIEGLLISLGFGFAEELLFRGWLQDELERDYSLSISLWTSSIIFSALHFIRPWQDMIRTLPQFPGLLLLGLILVWAKRSTKGRLGLSIGLHGGLVWGYYIIRVGKLVTYSNNVSDWITGVNENPLAGLIGLIFLGAIAFFLRKKAQAESNII